MPRVIQLLAPKRIERWVCALRFPTAAQGRVWVRKCCEEAGVLDLRAVATSKKVKKSEEAEIGGKPAPTRSWISSETNIARRLVGEWQGGRGGFLAGEDVMVEDILVPFHPRRPSRLSKEGTSERRISYARYPPDGLRPQHDILKQCRSVQVLYRMFCRIRNRREVHRGPFLP